MRIVHYTSAHPWSSSRIFYKMCVHTAALGHEVALVAMDPEANEHRSFQQDGVTVYLRAGMGRKGRLNRATRFAREVTRFAASLKPDILQFHDPELIPFTATDLPWRVPLIFDAHEDFVAQLDGKDWVRGGIKRQGLRLALKAMRAFINWRATHIIAATDGVRAAYDAAKSSTIRNLPILKEFETADRLPLPQRAKDACYIGGLSRARGIVELVEAAGKSRELNRLWLAGKFETKALQQEVEALPGWAKVSYLGYIDRQKIVEVLEQVRAGMVTLHALPNHVHAIPIKMLEYLGAGVPSVTSDIPYWREFVDDGQTGLFVDPQDPQQIAEAMDACLSNQGALAFEQSMTPDVRRRYAWEEENLRLEEVYKRSC